MMIEVEDGRALARRREIAAQAIDPCVTSSAVVAAFREGPEGGIDRQASYEAMRAQVQEVRSGVLASAEATLVGQAAALNMIFVNMALRGQAGLDRPGNAADRYLRLAMKAQNQCRATLNALADMASRPSKGYEEGDARRRIERPVVLSQTNIAQANISHGPMQVNSGRYPAPAGPAAEGENAENIRNELEDWADGEGLDGGTAGGLFADDADAEGVGAFDRPAYE